MLLLEKAKKLDKSVQKNSITMKEIVEEVRKVRDENSYQNTTSTSR